MSLSMMLSLFLVTVSSVSQCSGRLNFFHYYRFLLVMLPSLLSVAPELLIEKHFKGGGGAEGGGGRVAVELLALRDRLAFHPGYIPSHRHGSDNLWRLSSRSRV